MLAACQIFCGKVGKEQIGQLFRGSSVAACVWYTLV